MKFHEGIMNIIRTKTDTSEGNCQQIEAVLRQDMPKAFEAFELVTIPEIKDEAQQLTGQPINDEMADDISESLYSDLRSSSAFTPEYIDTLIVKSFNERFSHISIAPVDNGEPPNIVHATIADKFIAVGILADDRPPKNQGEAELISDIGSDQTAAEQFAQFLTQHTAHQVAIHDEGEEPDFGAKP